MAKLVKKNGEITNCNILNESENQYLVEYKNHTGFVNKDRVFNLNKVDEGVLNSLKRFGSSVKTIAGKVKKFFENIFLDRNNHVKIVDNNGDFIAGWPGNGIDVMASDGMPIVQLDKWAQTCHEKQLEQLGEFAEPSEDEIEIEDELGDEYVEESVQSNRFFRINEEEDEIGTAETEAKDADDIFLNAAHMSTKKYNTLSKEEKLKSSYILSVGTEKLTKILNLKYRELLTNAGQTQCVCIWGAPGIGKTAMTGGFCDSVNTATRKVFRKRSLYCSTMCAGDFFIPGYYDKVNDLINKSEKGATTFFMDWLPAYRIPSGAPQSHIRFLDECVNLSVIEKSSIKYDDFGFVSDFKIKTDEKTGELLKGPGGMLFFDELSRVKGDAKDLMMFLFNEHAMGQNVMLGSRWLVVAAANRQSDLLEVQLEDSKMDPAMNRRIFSVNYIPTFEEWRDNYATQPISKAYKSSAEEPVKLLDYLAGKEDELTAIHPLFLSFIENNPEYFYKMSKGTEGASEFDNINYYKACPANWEAVTKETYMYLDSEGGDIDSIDREDFEMFAIPILGWPVTKAFEKFMDAAVFSKKNIFEIYKTGNTNVSKGLAPTYLKSYLIPKLVELNPNPKLFETAKEATSEEIHKRYPVDELMNVFNYMYKSCNKFNKEGQAGQFFAELFIQWIKSLEEIDGIDFKKDFIGDSYYEKFTRMVSASGVNDAFTIK